MSAKIADIRSRISRASERTVWTFVRVKDDDGIVGWGEATLNGAEADLVAALGRVAPLLVGSAADPFRDMLRDTTTSRTDRAASAIVSAIDQAVWDIAARRSGKPLHAMLGTASRQDIPLYANINRRTVDRSPSGFAASARVAAERGFSTIKIAPFDGVAPGSSAGIAEGIARAKAVRDEIGPTRTLLVDCHWRFDEENARVALGRLAEIGISWFECPLPEVPENFDALRRLRAAANANRIRLAGAETETGVDGFRPFVEGGLYDVIMPDVKYAGGLAEMRKIADFAAAHGVDVSPHNPSGPICHVASLQFCAALERETMLEHQFDESPVFFEIIDGTLPTPIAGKASLPQANGLGLSLREDRLAPPTA